MKINANRKRDLTDRQLLKRISQRDAAAFGVLYDRYRPKVYSYALRIAGSETVAEDIVQEVFVKLWQLDGIDDLDNVGAYLRVVTRNQTLKWLRRNVLETHVGEVLTRRWADVDRSTEEKVDLKDTQEVIDSAVSLLPPQRRLIFQLCKNEGLKYEEVAERTNLSRLTVKTHMQLALRFLRNYMLRYEDVVKLSIMAFLPLI